MVVYQRLAPATQRAGTIISVPCDASAIPTSMARCPRCVVFRGCFLREGVRQNTAAARLRRSREECFAQQACRVAAIVNTEH
jgi:hypothetical protein